MCNSLGALNEQSAQVNASSLGDAAQTGSSSTGVLPGRQTQPGRELRPVLELSEVTHRGNECRCGDGADAHQFGGTLDLLIDFLMISNALIAPFDVDPKLGQQATNAVDAGSSFFVEPFSQPVHAEHALLCQVLGGRKFMCGLEAASQTVAASFASFLPLRPCIRYGATQDPGIIRAPNPRSISLRLQWCAPLHGSIAIKQPAGKSAHQGRNFSRVNFLQIQPWHSGAITWKREVPSYSNRRGCRIEAGAHGHPHGGQRQRRNASGGTAA